LSSYKVKKKRKNSAALPQEGAPSKLRCDYCTIKFAQTVRIAVRLLPQRASPVAIVPQNPWEREKTAIPCPTPLLGANFPHSIPKPIKIRKSFRNFSCFPAKKLWYNTTVCKMDFAEWEGYVCKIGPSGGLFSP
jgi:hypothetical protein